MRVILWVQVITRAPEYGNSSGVLRDSVVCSGRLLPNPRKVSNLFGSEVTAPATGPTSAPVVGVLTVVSRLLSDGGHVLYLPDPFC